MIHRRGLAHSICINLLIGLLPAASPVNNCWASLIWTSGGKTLWTSSPGEKNAFVTSKGEQKAQTSHLGKKGHFQDRASFFWANQSQSLFCGNFCRLPPLQTYVECTDPRFKAYPLPHSPGSRAARYWKNLALRYLLFLLYIYFAMWKKYRRFNQIQCMQLCYSGTDTQLVLISIILGILEV